MERCIYISERLNQNVNFTLLFNASYFWRKKRKMKVYSMRKEAFKFYFLLSLFPNFNRSMVLMTFKSKWHSKLYFLKTLHICTCCQYSVVCSGGSPSWSSFGIPVARNNLQGQNVNMQINWLIVFFCCSPYKQCLSIWRRKRHVGKSKCFSCIIQIENGMVSVLQIVA